MQGAPPGNVQPSAGSPATGHLPLSLLCAMLESDFTAVGDEVCAVILLVWATLHTKDRTLKLLTAGCTTKATKRQYDQQRIIIRDRRHTLSAGAQLHSHATAALLPL